MTTTTSRTTSLAADPQLPHRDVLLDDTLVGERLAVLRGDGAPPLRSCVRRRAKYRIGESLRATFVVRAEDDETVVSARMFPAGSAPTQLAKAAALAGASAAGRRASVLVDPSVDTVFWVFPSDRKLVGLSALQVPPDEARDVFGPAWTRSRLLAYSPEKAATARCLTDAGETIGYAKIQLGDQGRRSIDVLHAVRRGAEDQDLLSLPAPVGYVPEHHLALYEPAPGRPMSELPPAELPAAMGALGRALSVLHRQPVGQLPPFARLLPSRLRRAAELVGTARPDVAAVVGQLATVLLAHPPSPAATALLHGDVHAKNVLVHPTGVSLVDLDQAAGGPAAAELGGLLARICCPRGRAGLSPATRAAAARALMASYRGPIEPRDLTWYAAAALLVERALRSVNRVDAEGLDELAGVVATALDWAESREGAWA